jgi:hypothetical protein
MLSIAPGAALMPYWICTPSKAGPAAHDATRSFSPVHSATSPFVPMSTARTGSVREVRSAARTTPTVSAPTKPAMEGRQ